MKTSLGILLLLLTACGGDAPAKTSKGPIPPERLFKSQQCLVCHGPGGRGMPGSGPDLRNIDEYWTVESLVRYLAKPKEYADSDPRLLKNRPKYRMQMPNTPLNEDQLRRLAEFVLALE